MLALLTVLAALADAPPPPDALPGPESSGDRRVGPFSKDTYPSEVIARPLTVPAGMIRLSPSLDETWYRLATYSWITSLGVAASYGLHDQVEVSASTQFAVSPRVEARWVGVGGAILFQDGPAFDMAVTARFLVAPSATSLLPTVVVGFPGRFLVSDRVFLTFGADLVSLQISPLQPQAAVKLGAGAQLTSNLAVALETDALKLAGQAFFFRMLVLPLDVTATLAVAKGFDLQAHAFTFNLADPRLAGTLTLAGSAYF